MSQPSHPIVAATLDLAMSSLARVRERVVPEATGDVLEIGVGTGLNFARYRDVRSLAGIEPDPHMLRRARRRAERLGIDIALEPAGAEKLPYDDARFDTVVCTFSLCTIPDPTAALAEMRRVLRPGGTLLFAEHVASARPLMRRVQRALDPAWAKVAGGCHLTRDALALVAEAGFVDVEHRTHGGQDFTLTPVISGRARRPVSD